ncbi:MAG: RNA polymerase sigma factor [Planctomycetota bacterium]
MKDFDQQSREQGRALVGYLYALSRDYHLAEDMAQETLLIAYRKRVHYFPEADFGAWLRAIARNVWMRERKARAKGPHAVEGIERFAEDLFTASLYSDLKWKREKEALTVCMRALEQADRSLIREHFGSGRKYSELARRAQRTVSWVKVRMFRARRSLADCIKRRLAGVEGRP